MSASSPIVPRTPETIAAFQQMISAKVERPVVDMNDETARNLDIIWSSIDEAAKTWRGGKDLFFPGMPKNRKDFWGTFAKDHSPTPLPVVEDFIIGNSHGDGKTAIDLGAGNSPAIKPLLERGWKVIAIDSSLSALEVLAAQNKAAIENKQLCLFEADVNDFTPKNPVDLVIAADIFPYINPSQFRATWAKVHDLFLKEEGHLIGTLFRSAPKHDEKLVPHMNLLKEMGVWFLPDRRMVRPLLTQAGYDIETCRYRIDDPSCPAFCIQFIAQKIAQNKA